ncbi:hypothetical protein [Lysinibacillus antri]|uniref:Uncharacterized protein n=1 Tax=Lysinibacillus antri TaxID=2498145 RepID=A0A432LDT8_9BACI|nr:hypothetical protein [Lysinibacillus antri]RUL53958.1 hypothetical protein EK386_07455 [Lysinibacillus antri]
MSTPSKSGKLHVINVGQAINHYITNQSLGDFSESVRQTAQYIIQMYPQIGYVTTKYNTTHPDLNPDLLLTLQDKQEVKINLFYIKGNAKVQAKNIGTKSFLQKYFKSETLQLDFNQFFEKEYVTYLKNIVNTKEVVNDEDSTAQLKKMIANYYPKFVDEIDPFRKNLLFALREHCFYLLKQQFNERSLGILNAFKEFLLIDTINIITRYQSGNKCLLVEQWKTTIDSTQDIYLYKKGMTTVGIRIGNEAVTLRFKFESGPTSSIKLATSYDHFPTEETVIQENLKSVQMFESIIEKHTQTTEDSLSNAIGKCHEAMTYYRILKENPTISQVDSHEYQNMLIKYSSNVPTKTLQDLHTSSESAEKAIQEYLKTKYKTFVIESIQLIPESYLENRLDTRDLLVILRVNNQYVEEGFSLKAIAKNKVKITSKNAGAGQILGPKYFNCGSLDKVIKETETVFKQNGINHIESLERVSIAIGESLQKTTQANLKKGITAILGHAPTLVTVYTINKSKMIQHGEVKGEIHVYPNTPSAIQTTLQWDQNQEELTLRVKFSGGQSKGWTSVKLACEYMVVI